MRGINRRRIQGFRLALFFTIAGFSIASATEIASAQTTAPANEQAVETHPGNDLAGMSLEDLMNIEVTSVSKHRQKVSEAPAAVSVITQDDIARSGLHSIPELLRLSPGLDVARINAHDWAISARGFNDQYANKLLVLVDGRTVYAPLFSGVAWDQQGYTLEDLDRIEVIRGPGATMWGANAVNGVINITTKSAKDTQGVLVSGLGSNVDSEGAVRYGGKIGQDNYYRVYGMFNKTQDFVNAAGDEQFDGWQSTRGGFRFDRESGKDTFTLEGDAYENYFAETSIVPSFQAPFSVPTYGTHHASGTDILGRWTHEVSSESEYSVQMYYDRFYRTQNVLTYLQNTFDGELQYRFPVGRIQSLILGAGARFLTDQTEESTVISFDPADRNDYRLNTFIQDDIAVVQDRLHVILGTKLEYSSYSDFEYQPSGRVLWTPNDRNTVWGAVSRAIHTPTQDSQDATVVVQTFPGPGGIPTGVVSVPNPDINSEELMAYELGYRVKPMEQFSIDLASFYNHYDHLRNSDVGTPTFEALPSPRVIIPAVPGNGLSADSYGLELGANLNVTPNWRVSGAYSLLVIDARANPGSNNAVGAASTNGVSPRNQVQLHSYYRLMRSIDLDASAYYVESLSFSQIPSYIRVDLGVTWHPRENLSLGVGVQNLLDNHHPEFGPGYFSTANEFPRAVYGQLTWRF